MSTRSQCKITSTDFSTPIYLYQHYDGYDLMSTVCNAIKKGDDRLDTPEYLTRIIFSNMIKNDIMGTTGYGIGTSQHGDIEYLVEVNIDNQTVTEFEVYHETHLKPLRTFKFTEIPDEVMEYSE